VDHCFHRTPLVPSCLKALQYLLPCAVGAAQCRLSNEVNSLGCAAQYDRRARANAQLRIDWKVRHGYLTPSCGPSSIHVSLPKTFEPTAGVRVGKHADGRTLRSRHSLGLLAHSAAKRARRTDCTITFPAAGKTCRRFRSSRRRARLRGAARAMLTRGEKLRRVQVTRPVL
jgi:hypothetical protein